MYGSGMYGGGMYGSGYGSSMYGGGMYGGGMMGMPGPGGMLGMNTMMMGVNSVSRLSQLLQMTSEALHMAFSSLVRLLGSVTHLTQEFGAAGQAFTTFSLIRVLWSAYHKLKLFFLRLIGQRDLAEKLRMQEAWQHTGADFDDSSLQPTSNAPSGKWSWTSFFFFTFGTIWVAKKVFRLLERLIVGEEELKRRRMAQARVDAEKKRAENEARQRAQQQMQGDMPPGARPPFGSSYGGGYGGGGFGSGYGMGSGMGSYGSSWGSPGMYSAGPYSYSGAGYGGW
jgi:hypothetical protein